MINVKNQQILEQVKKRYWKEQITNIRKDENCATKSQKDKEKVRNAIGECKKRKMGEIYKSKTKMKQESRM